MAGQKGEAMKKRLGGLVLLAALGGCTSSQPGSYMSNVGPGGAPINPPGGSCPSGACPRPVPGVMGAYGESILVQPPMQGEAPGAIARNGQPDPARAARISFAQSVGPAAAEILAKEDAKKNVGLMASGVPEGGILRAG